MIENMQYFITHCRMESKTQPTSKQSSPSVMRSFTDSKEPMAPMKVLVIFIIIFILGSGTGYLLSGFGGKSGVNEPISTKDGAKSGKIFGSNDTKTFKDIAEGVVREGGIDGEGQFHLERPGGQSQNVYMTSSTVDLSQFIGKKIKVWGETQAAQKAGWLMDVGRVEVL
jgi:hypothetical protein